MVRGFPAKLHLHVNLRSKHSNVSNEHFTGIKLSPLTFSLNAFFALCNLPPMHLSSFILAWRVFTVLSMFAFHSISPTSQATKIQTPLASKVFLVSHKTSAQKKERSYCELTSIRVSNPSVSEYVWISRCINRFGAYCTRQYGRMWYGRHVQTEGWRSWAERSNWSQVVLEADFDFVIFYCCLSSKKGRWA